MDCTGPAASVSKVSDLASRETLRLRTLCILCARMKVSAFVASY